MDTIENELVPEDEARAEMSAAQVNDLPDSDFAYIEPGGTKDSGGKTIPRSKRHFPIQDAAHVRNALARIAQGAEFGTQALPKVRAAAKKFGVEVSGEQNAAFDELDQRDDVDETETRDGGGDGLEFRRRLADRLKGTIEHREFEASGLECRELADGTLRMSGYASVTEHGYEVGPFTETIRRGAFKRTLSEDPDVVLLYGHEGMPLARTKAGSLALEENAKGLHWTADLDSEDPDSRVLARKVDRGLIDQCSFAFQVTQQDWNEEMTERSIKAVSIHRGDVSLVAMGANEATSVGVTSLRSADGQLEIRAGAAISANNRTKLQSILDGLTSADVDIDAALSSLAGVLGVPNPDKDKSDDAPPPAPKRALPPDTTAVARLQWQRMREARS